MPSRIESIKNVWACGALVCKMNSKGCFVTYGLMGHPLDPGRKLMLLNFYERLIFRLARKLLIGSGGSLRQIFPTSVMSSLKSQTAKTGQPRPDI